MHIARELGHFLSDDFAINSVDKYANSSQFLVMFENLRVASANLKQANDFFEARNLSVPARLKNKSKSLISLSKTLPKDFAQEEIMEVDAEPLPGKGKKFIFKVKINNSNVNVIIDTGSSTTLVQKSLVIDLNLKHYTSRLPVNFLGMFGSKMVPDAKIASLSLQIGNKSLAMPAYIMDTLPYGPPDRY